MSAIEFLKSSLVIDFLKSALFIELLFGVITSINGSSKGRSGYNWFLIGFFLGPLGLLISVVVSTNVNAIIHSKNMRKCPFCGELIQNVAIVCRFCRHDLPKEEIPANSSWAESIGYYIGKVIGLMFRQKQKE